MHSFVSCAMLCGWMARIQFRERSNGCEGGRGEGGGAVRGMKLAKEPLISACCVIVTHDCTLVKSEMISAGTQDGW